ncbi:MAG: tRNA pseudouridine(38-40) synthase TruA [Rickettsiales bacterium]|jgi:tRNA pseudouridine38-40 synthase|nr:tRNA pseudouridine(38-40) synthase TruA [Rickettsiales bacterium]
MKYRLEIEYFGDGYSGWQTQEGQRSIAGSLSNALFALCGERREFVGAGRTDAGVHALKMTAHVEVEKAIPLANIVPGMNFWLLKNHDSIVVLRATRAAEDFHARFSCKGREYLYRILARPVRGAISEGRAWWVRKPLDWHAMEDAAQKLVGRHDFTSLRAAECQAKSPIKTLDSLHVLKKGDFVEIRAKAKSFLHHQVRNIAGTLKLVGEGKLAAADMARILEARDRSAAGPTAPACGLYFVKARY